MITDSEVNYVSNKHKQGYMDKSLKFKGLITVLGALKILLSSTNINVSSHLAHY